MELKASELRRFKRWLNDQGAEIMKPTNPYEVLRFKANGGTHILYERDNGILTPTGEVEIAFKAWKNQAKWTARKTTNNKKDPNLVETILERDGDRCFYCHLVIQKSQRTVEHVLSRTHGGNNHIANRVLAHLACNKQAGNRSIIEKVKIREKNWARIQASQAKQEGESNA